METLKGEVIKHHKKKITKEKRGRKKPETSAISMTAREESCEIPKRERMGVPRGPSTLSTSSICSFKGFFRA